jgi:ribonucleoside-diphosphate reductase alpha chain
MGILESWHPDIEKFITMKTKPGMYENFNVSVGIWSDFWKSLVNKEDHKYSLKNPRTKANVKNIDSHQLMELIALSAWKSAEPGVIFFDNINKYNPCIDAKGGPLRATNPCGEQSLYPCESCNLGSINLSKFVKRKADGMYEFDWPKYEQSIRTATRFLDNIIDVNKYPVEEIDINTKLTRRIGLGIMGIADLLFMLQIPYDSKEGYEFMSKLAETLSYFSMDESVVISKSRGAFPLFDQTEYKNGDIPLSGYHEIPKDSHYYDWDSLIEKIKNHGIRNSWTTTIAPTGTLSMISDVSNGVEPVFALVFEKRVTVGRFFYMNKIFENVLKEHGLYTDEILIKIANNYGSVRGINEIPEWIQKLFVTAIDIHWTDHIMAQAVWQKWISNAIAKTINMPGDVTVEDVKCAYLLAHEFGLKGVTIYRDGSRNEQVLHITGNDREKRFQVKPSMYLHDYILANIHEPYVLDQVNPIFKDYESSDQYTVATNTVDNQLEPTSFESDTVSINTKPDPYTLTRTESDKEACPVCKNYLIITEGCNMCIECGFSSCGSG